MATYDIDAAREAGISEQDIAQQLSQAYNYDLQGALDAGVTVDKIIPELMTRGVAAPKETEAEAGYFSQWGADIKDAGKAFVTDEAQVEALKYGQVGAMGGIGEGILSTLTGIVSPVTALPEMAYDSVKHAFGNDPDDPNATYKALKAGREQLVNTLEGMKARGNDTTMMEQNIARIDADIAREKETYDEWYSQAETPSVGEYREDYTYQPRLESGKAVAGAIGQLPIFRQYGELSGAASEQLGENWGDSPESKRRIAEGAQAFIDTAAVAAPIAKGVRARTPAGRARTEAQAGVRAKAVEAKAAEKAAAKSKGTAEKIENIDNSLRELDASVNGVLKEYGPKSQEYAQAREFIEVKKADLEAAREPLVERYNKVQAEAAEAYLRRTNPEFDAVMTKVDAATSAARRAELWKKAKGLIPKILGMGAKAVANTVVPGSSRAMTVVAGVKKAADVMIESRDAAYASPKATSVRTETVPEFKPTEAPKAEARKAEAPKSENIDAEVKSTVDEWTRQMDEQRVKAEEQKALNDPKHPDNQLSGSAPKSDMIPIDVAIEMANLRAAKKGGSLHEVRILEQQRARGTTEVPRATEGSQRRAPSAGERKAYEAEPRPVEAPLTEAQKKANKERVLKELEERRKLTRGSSYTPPKITKAQYMEELLKQRPKRA